MLTFSQAFTEKFSIVKMMELNRDPRSYEGGALKKKKILLCLFPSLAKNQIISRSLVQSFMHKFSYCAYISYRT